ncbi:nucleoside hydrolase-like [Daphnia carinata]|uniref:nucleoside hydrolase-like n=1 Tax=Daphnia carinata TaxID=120202 RepID=UPI00257B839F|nr:nucleoside hydrolase-like [Daphnia carinata]
MAKKMIVDCDAGMDDASALFLATKAHKVGVLELVAITTTHGNTTLNNVVRNVARTLTTANLNQIPIYRGAHTSLVEPVVMDDPFHGSDGFGDSNHDEEPDLRNVQKEHAVNALVRLVKENPNEMTVVALGPLTNLALAMRLDDQFASNLKELYIMGGNVEGIGNITVSAEFNFHCDPEAAYIVLQNTKCPTYIASWELCLHRAKLDWDWRINTYGGVDSPQCRLMNKIEAQIIARKYFDTYIVCDQLAVAAAIDPRYVTQQSLHYATVELSGNYTRGQMVVDYGKKIVGKTPNVYLIDRVDIELFKKMMLWSLDDPSVDYTPPTE